MITSEAEPVARDHLAGLQKGPSAPTVLAYCMHVYTANPVCKPRAYLVPTNSERGLTLRREFSHGHGVYKDLFLVIPAAPSPAIVWRNTNTHERFFSHKISTHKFDSKIFW